MMLHSLWEWLKDPFGKRSLSKHASYINDMYVTRVLTKKANERVQTSVAQRRVMGGANAIDRSVLGTYQHARKRRHVDEQG
jgi:hypothetical protein